MQNVSRKQASVSEAFNEIEEYAHNEINDAFLKMEVSVEIVDIGIDIKANIGRGKHIIALTFVYLYGKNSDIVSDFATFVCDYIGTATHGKAILLSAYAYSIQLLSSIQGMVS